MMGIEPITRKEKLMAAAAGENVVAPTPVTREEYFLSKIGGGSVLIDIPADDPGWSNDYYFDISYDPIYEALMANKTVILRAPYDDDSGVTVEWRTLVTQWEFHSNTGLLIIVGGGNAWTFTNGSYHTTA